MNENIKIISITSGKGGVGKTSILANLALKFSEAGKRVLILDGDLGMANVDIFFGVRTDSSIYDVITHRKSFREILVPVAPNVHLIPGGSGIVGLNQLTAFQRRSILDQLYELPKMFDVVLVDTAPGISDNVLYLNSAADQVCVVVTPDPASITDSYALIKVLNKSFKKHRFNIICNMVRDQRDGILLFEKFNDVTTRFLNVGLDFLGMIPMDPNLRKLNLSQRLIMKHDPASQSATSLTEIANRVLDKTQESVPFGNHPFWEQVVGVA